MQTVGGGAVSARVLTSARARVRVQACVCECVRVRARVHLCGRGCLEGDEPCPGELGGVAEQVVKDLREKERGGRAD